MSFGVSLRKTLSSSETVPWASPFTILSMASWHIVRRIKEGTLYKAPSAVSFLPCSVAILLYLTRKYKVPDHWYPQDLQACSRVDEYLAWQHTTLRRSCLRALWHKVRPRGGGGGSARVSPQRGQGTIAFFFSIWIISTDLTLTPRILSSVVPMLL